MTSERAVGLGPCGPFLSVRVRPYAFFLSVKLNAPRPVISNMPPAGSGTGASDGVPGRVFSEDARAAAGPAKGSPLAERSITANRGVQKFRPELTKRAEKIAAEQASIGMLMKPTSVSVADGGTGDALSTQTVRW